MRALRFNLVPILSAVMSIWVVTARSDAADSAGFMGPIRPSEKKAEPPLPTVNDAVRLCASDLSRMSPAERAVTRYIWIWTGSNEDAKAVAGWLNHLSSSPVPYLPIPAGAAKLLVLRVNLLRLYPRPDDLKRGGDAWEEFQFDPKLNLLITKDTLQLLSESAREALPKVKVRRAERKVRTVTKRVAVKLSRSKSSGLWWLSRDGGEHWVQEESEEGKALRELSRTGETVEKEEVFTAQSQVEIDVGDLESTDVVRVTGAYVDRVAFGALVAGTGSLAPIVSHDYFLFRACSTIKGQGLYQVIYGGLYNELAGIPRAGKKGTDLDALFRDLGLGDVAKGLSAADIFDQLGSDQRVAVFRSDVTGKPRVVFILKTPIGRNGMQGLLIITGDITDADVDIGTHPILNLEQVFQDFRGQKVKVKAYEAIWERANGAHGFALYNGEGKLLEVAAPDVAADRTVPAPHTLNLQSGISCVRCHTARGHDGWQPLKNDVQVLLKRYRADVFGDVGDKDRAIAETVDRIAGHYSGDPMRKLIPRGRDDYAEAVLRFTGPWKEAKGDQADAATVWAKRLEAVYGAYWYDLVDAKEALRELGVDPAGEEPLEALRKLLPPEKAAAVDGVIPEDPRIGALLAGLSINRSDWDLSYSFAAGRAAKTLALRQRQMGPPAPARKVG